MSWTRERGRVVVVMNRDERRDRTPAQPPRLWPGVGGGFTAPEDPDGGGTWIAACGSGLVLALVNHQPGRGARAPRPAQRLSRGLLVTALATDAAVPDAARIRAAGLERLAPFRLFAIGPAITPRVFTWNGVRLAGRRLDPRIGFLTSSSWNPRSVLPARQAAFRAFARTHPRPTPAQLIAFHDGVDHPRGTPWAIHMSRDDARTVSRTVIEWDGRRASMTYVATPKR